MNCASRTQEGARFFRLFVASAISFAPHFSHAQYVSKLRGGPGGVGKKCNSVCPTSCASSGAGDSPG
eukprot:5124509-Pleurochrysis_carterae.AAC.1